MAVGAFLLTFGVTMIVAIPEIFLVFGIGVQNANTASEFALVSVVISSVGASILAYGVGQKQV